VICTEPKRKFLEGGGLGYPVFSRHTCACSELQNVTNTIEYPV